MRFIPFLLGLFLFTGCLVSGELSPRYRDPLARERIDPGAFFPGVHLHGLSPGWLYLTEHGAGPGDMAVVTERRTGAVFYMSARGRQEHPHLSIGSIQRMREKYYLRGEHLMAIDYSRPDRASITYSVDADMDGRDLEVQRTAYRRLHSARTGKSLVMTLHGRWPMAHHERISAAFDAAVEHAELK